MKRSERPTIPQWGGELKRKPEQKESGEAEPVWRDIAIGQEKARGWEHVENGIVDQDSVQVIEEFEGRVDAVWAGVYDGHYLPKEILSADTVPDKLVVKNLAKLFHERVKAGDDYEKAFKIAFEEADKIINNQSWEKSYNGSTASVLLIEGKEAWVANVGDSHIYKFSKKSEPKMLSMDHNIKTNEDAKQEAITRGGVYANGYVYNPGSTGLKLSRSLGDRGMGEVVSCVPRVQRFEIAEEDEWIIVASDGLWDVLAVNDVQSVLNESSGADDAQKKLIKAAKRVEGVNFDDISVVAIELKNKS